jgi:hypothetical protein
MRAYRLLDAKKSDFDSLSQLIGTSESSKNAYISLVSIESGDLILTNCNLISDRYVESGGKVAVIDLSKFEFMTI